MSKENVMERELIKKEKGKGKGSLGLTINI